MYLYCMVETVSTMLKIPLIISSGLRTSGPGSPNKKRKSVLVFGIFIVNLPL